MYNVLKKYLSTGIPCMKCDISLHNNKELGLGIWQKYQITQDIQELVKKLLSALPLDPQPTLDN